ncbi:MAG TPA: hypothetical protein VFW65_12135 [Pseudonocardiaceae bacterium]|nr:hypothetical protein [Pseudonocardiaceae bacterium]
MTNIQSALSDSSDELTEFWVEIPTGYVPLPTDAIDENMAVATEVLHERADPDQQRIADVMIDLLTSYLHALASRNGVYCGVGRHLSAVDGTAISSSLVVALQEFPEKVNPRVLLKDLLVTKSEAGDQGQADLVDVQGRPMLFVECSRELPTPTFPGLPEPPDGGTSTVFQIEALVPSEDGSKLVSIEFSTPFVAHGPEFRTMVVTMAGSVSFDPPQAEPGRAVSISDMLGG